MNLLLVNKWLGLKARHVLNSMSNNNLSWFLIILYLHLYLFLINIVAAVLPLEELKGGILVRDP